MVKYGIEIFGRVKPGKGRIGDYDCDEGDDGYSYVSFNIPKDLARDFINNKKEIYKFRFNKAFDRDTKQDDIFEHVARGVIDNVLSGYNGTIFAYGQTGSGKTFTITGGAERYADRGIIPRTLSYMFECFEKNPEYVYTSHVSYLEVYNENGYDLLDPKHEAAKLEDLPKIALMEDNDGNIHLKNLSLHQANNEEEALNWLFLGDTNRMIAETPMNQASTRSHCIFTIHISSREPGSATLRRAKLHLVDLAGSERIHKTGVDGTILTEAKYINLSLHYLEQVIVALSEKSRTHIPYRNSMLTSVLRDSLGGNCRTTMIATLSVDRKNIDESISTCRFAQRVAMIKNDAVLNEEIDPKLMIIKLKQEIQQLKDELSMSSGMEYKGELTEEEIERLKYMIKTYIEDKDPESSLLVGADMRKINLSFKLFKGHVLDRKPSNSPDTARSNGSLQRDNSYLSDQNEATKLKELIHQRDNEINILVGMLKRERERVQGNSKPSSSESISHERSKERISRRTQPTSSSSEVSSDKQRQTLEERQQPVATREEANGHSTKPSQSQQMKDDMSQGRREAFEVFRADYPHNSNIEENKRTLKQRYGEAKTLGEQVNNSRKKINTLKTQIEQHRIRRSMQVEDDGQNDEEDRLRSAIEDEKSRYKEAFTRLRSLKTEIEHLQHLLEKFKVQMQKDFEVWWNEQSSLPQRTQSKKVASAWKTPTPPLSPIKPQENRPRASTDPRTPGRVGGADHWRNPAGSEESSREDKRHSSAEGGRSMKNAYEDAKRYSSSNGKASLNLTGDSQADEDIMAFIRARQSLLDKRRGSNHK
ncbi:kinesin-like protein KIF6 isoform X1 [Dendronephthya gigantea]|uniref:kinesin-like protein KIF6 isoform X1 n=1 Tax=Dendronephthya gigantea TaxID=151771 RepID=UPI00106B0F66|nr:kinesin-like protein KIF6 isoform X1 [Dendronephthya gigantea]XP_028398654.1 kinesin-like protein KIF6 isoform X1 [Dendronephthya gigantea]